MSGSIRQGLARPGARGAEGGASSSSYYGRPVLKAPTWSERDVAGYFFLGGVAAGSALLGAGGALTGRPALRRVGRLGAAGAILLSAGALVHDLGRPGRFLNMLRVAKPTSPMSVGSWLLAAFGPGAGVAAAAELASALPLPRSLLSRLRLAGSAGAAVSAALAPLVATYTAVIVADTAVPAWHEAYPELPFVFAGSAAAGASGLALLAVPLQEAGPPRRLALAGAAMEAAASTRMERRLGLVGEPLRGGRGGRLLKAAQALTAGGALLGLLGGRSRLLARAAGACLMGGSLCTRLGVFRAGLESASDPRYTVEPQRERLQGARAELGSRGGE